MPSERERETRAALWAALAASRTIWAAARSMCHVRGPRRPERPIHPAERTTAADSAAIGTRVNATRERESVRCASCSTRLVWCPRVTVVDGLFPRGDARVGGRGGSLVTGAFVRGVFESTRVLEEERKKG